MNYRMKFYVILVVVLLFSILPAFADPPYDTNIDPNREDLEYYGEKSGDENFIMILAFIGLVGAFYIFNQNYDNKEKEKAAFRQESILRFQNELLQEKLINMEKNNVNNPKVELCLVENENPIVLSKSEDYYNCMKISETDIPYYCKFVSCYDMQECFCEECNHSSLFSPETMWMNEERNLYYRGGKIMRLYGMNTCIMCNGVIARIFYDAEGYRFFYDAEGCEKRVLEEESRNNVIPSYVKYTSFGILDRAKSVSMHNLVEVHCYNCSNSWIYRLDVDKEVLSSHRKCNKCGYETIIHEYDLSSELMLI